MITPIKPNTLKLKSSDLAKTAHQLQNIFGDLARITLSADRITLELKKIKLEIEK